jgi:hypothetical protein
LQEIFSRQTREIYGDKTYMVPRKSAKHEQDRTNIMNAMQTNLTCSRTMKSTPPQGVNGFILSDPNLLNPQKRIVGFVHEIQSSQNCLHYAQQPFIKRVVVGLMRLLLEVS